MLFEVVATIIGSLTFCQFLGNLFEVEERLLPYTYIKIVTMYVKGFYAFIGEIMAMAFFYFYHMIKRIYETLDRILGGFFTALKKTFHDIYSSIEPLFQFGEVLRSFKTWTTKYFENINLKKWMSMFYDSCWEILASLSSLIFVFLLIVVVLFF